MERGAIYVNGLLVLLLFFAGIGFWIWALVDVIRVSDDSMFRAGNKLVWVLVVVFTGWIGAIIYLAVGRPQPGTGSGGTGGGFAPPPARPD